MELSHYAIAGLESSITCSIVSGLGENTKFKISNHARYFVSFFHFPDRYLVLMSTNLHDPHDDFAGIDVSSNVPTKPPSLVQLFGTLIFLVLFLHGYILMLSDKKGSLIKLSCLNTLILH